MQALLNPTNDYVFKRLFAEAPALLVSLINDLRPDLPTIASVEVLNPAINAAELSGKCIILDVLARDGQGDCYNAGRAEPPARHKKATARSRRHIASHHLTTNNKQPHPHERR